MAIQLIKATTVTATRNNIAEGDNSSTAGLLRNCLTAMQTELVARLRRFSFRHGDLAIILDVHDLSVTGRVRAEDLPRSSAAEYLIEPG